MSIKRGASRLALIAGAASVCLAAVLTVSTPDAWASTVSNQVQFQPQNCSSAEWKTVIQYNSLITVTGTNQYGSRVTWRTTNHPDGVFLTSNWWWWGAVTITLHPASGGTISIPGYVPPTHSSNEVAIFGGNTVLFTCWGSEGVVSSVTVPQTAYGNNPGCISLVNPTGAYALQTTYTGRFYYNGGTYISGSTGGFTKTAASVMVVTNKVGEHYLVPRDSAIGTQPVCY